MIIFFRKWIGGEHEEKKYVVSRAILLKQNGTENDGLGKKNGIRNNASFV